MTGAPTPPWYDDYLYQQASNTVSGGNGLKWANAVTSTTPSAYTTIALTSQQAAAVQQYINSQQNRWPPPPQQLNHYTVRQGERFTLCLPDGSVIDVEPGGNYQIQDDTAKVIYKANRVREFNTYINASDKVEEFIKFCGASGVRQGEMLDIPLKHFIAWLILEAAAADKEDCPIPPFPALPDLSAPRCAVCKRFISRTNDTKVCRAECLEVYLERKVLRKGSSENGKDRTGSPTPKRTRSIPHLQNMQARVGKAQVLVKSRRSRKAQGRRA